jgi:hypothetical protein
LSTAKLPAIFNQALTKKAVFSGFDRRIG